MARNNENCKRIKMADICAYNSCQHGCHYCYANYDESKVQQNILNHDVNSSLLIGHLKKEDIIKNRKA